MQLGVARLHRKEPAEREGEEEPVTGKERWRRVGPRFQGAPSMQILRVQRDASADCSPLLVRACHDKTEEFQTRLGHCIDAIRHHKRCGRHRPLLSKSVQARVARVDNPELSKTVRKSTGAQRAGSTHAAVSSDVRLPKLGVAWGFVLKGYSHRTPGRAEAAPDMSSAIRTAPSSFLRQERTASASERITFP